MLRLVLKKRIFQWSISALALLLGAGCGYIFPAEGPNDALIEWLAINDLISDPSLVKVRVANRTSGYNVEIDLRIDGLTETFECLATQSNCTFALDEKPEVIEAVQCRWFDEDGGFRGGRTLDGLDEYTFTDDDFSEGSMVTYVISQEETTAEVL